MTDQHTDHRAAAEQWLARAEDEKLGGHEYQTAALIAIGHALLAGPPPTRVKQRFFDGGFVHPDLPNPGPRP